MDWLKTFQFRVDDLIESKGLVFTAEIWKVDENTKLLVTKLTKQIDIIEGKFFPFLDIAMF